jgi:hypothetical protein
MHRYDKDKYFQSINDVSGQFSFVLYFLFDSSLQVVTLYVHTVYFPYDPKPPETSWDLPTYKLLFAIF